jgi:streptomycin 6-kinase
VWVAFGPLLDGVRLSADDPGLAGGQAWLSYARAWAWPKDVPAETWFPRGLERRRQLPGGKDWLRRLPVLIGECVEAWELKIEGPYNGGKVGLALKVERSDGSPAVLKVSVPPRDTGHEADALAHWRGEGAVRLLERDDERHALLLERCDPGNQLSDLVDEDEAQRAAADVLRRIWRPPPPSHSFRRLADDADRWGQILPTRWKALGRPCDRALLDRAVSAYRELGAVDEESVVCHQDFHGGNVLRSTRESWLAIDPKPLLGDRAFDTAWLLRDRRSSVGMDPRPSRRFRRRLDMLSDELGLDRERIRGWGIARMLTWGLDGARVHRAHVECASLLLAV